LNLPEPAPAAQTPPRGLRTATARGERTRERLLDAAERLWADRGLEGVSLKEIRLAAGQRNSSALQFHFGDRDGLRLALAQRHLPRIASLQQEFYRRLVEEGRQDDLAGLVEVLVRPIAEYVRRGPSERAWLRIAAADLGRPEIAPQDLVDHSPPLAVHVGATIHAQLGAVIRPEVAGDRILYVVIACHHLCADRARLEDLPPGARRRPILSFEVWLDNLLDMAVAAMTAPRRRPGDADRSAGQVGGAVSSE
jgi:AcrR family transcriptional regulator